MSAAQLSLLDPPRSRRSDPKASRAAAAAVAGAQQQSECAAILDALRTSFLPLTYREVHARLKGRIAEPVEVMRRLDDLRNAGLVTNSITRRCGESGRLAQTWEVVR